MARRSPRRGFILLFGSRSIVCDDNASPPVHTTCPRCAHDVNMQARSLRHWFTIFFIPVFPVSRKTRFTQCPDCGAQFRLAPEELRARVGASEQAQNQEAIALYNSLRASPANSVTLNQLMMMYASMKEFDPAISAAGQFTQALHNSEQCMTTLGRVYLGKNDYASALQWLNAAVQRNPYLGEAQYYKAVAHLLTVPADFPAAIAAARAARGAGYPKAETLLQEAESEARKG